MPGQSVSPPPRLSRLQQLGTIVIPLIPGELSGGIAFLILDCRISTLPQQILNALAIPTPTSIEQGSPGAHGSRLAPLVNPWMALVLQLIDLGALLQQILDHLRVVGSRGHVKGVTSREVGSVV